MDRQEAMRARSYRLPLPPHAIASRQAHRVLEWALRDWRIDGDAAENARIVLSELVTNALTHSLDVFRLALCLNGIRFCSRSGTAQRACPPSAFPTAWRSTAGECSWSTR
jgi:hypothetical protein